MYLLINAVSEPATLLVFNEARKRLALESKEIKGKEFDLLLPWVEEVLSSVWGSIQSLDGIVIVNGPGSFTGMRIVTLTANSIAFAQNTPLYAIDIFSLGKLWGWEYPMILKANREEYLIKESETIESKLSGKDSIPPGICYGIWEENDFENGKISIKWSIDYESFLRDFHFGEKTMRVDPLYIKKPNIT